MEKPRRPIAVTSRGSSRRRAMTRARSGRLSGLTLVVALLEHARDEGTTRPVVVHEQHVHVLGRGARHRRASPSDVTRLRKTTADALDRAAPRDAALASLAPGTAHLAGCPPRSLLDRSDSPLRTVPAAACWPPFGRARTCEALESSPPSQAVSKGSLFRPRVARTNRRGTTRWPSPDSLYLALGKIRPFWNLRFLDSTLDFLFPNSPAGKWVGRRLRNQTWDPMWHGGAPGRDWLKKKP